MFILCKFTLFVWNWFWWRFCWRFTVFFCGILFAGLLLFMLKLDTRCVFVGLPNVIVLFGVDKMLVDFGSDPVLNRLFSIPPNLF